ncbi:MAG: nucleotide exchange factor GrpE [Lachnospiraceae bacterium]|nr:nucleotide exchange factor GrpE [Lachnospiraceae bacterium]
MGKKKKTSREQTIEKLNELKEAAEAEAAKEEAPAEEAAKEEAAQEEVKEEAKVESPSEETPEKAAEEAPEEGGNAKVAELKDKLMRQMAEFENYRKRTEKEKQAMFETGAKSVIEKLLPVVDNFERGLGALPEGEKNPFADGMQMVYKQLMDELGKLEVKPIEAVGKEFDPNLHNAVMHVEDEESPDNTVVEELQKGYTYRDSVVRHSMVKVAN